MFSLTSSHALVRYAINLWLSLELGKLHLCLVLQSLHSWFFAAVHELDEYCRSILVQLVLVLAKENTFCFNRMLSILSMD
jgi:hypothetical protein